VHLAWNVQENGLWLEEHGVVAKLLRGNLHQRQYVDEVGYSASRACLSQSIPAPDYWAVMLSSPSHFRRT
jgi:hypothetical protein